MRRFVATCALVTSISFSALLVAAPAEEAVRPSPAPTVTSLPKLRIDNFGQVNAAYYRGSQPAGDDYAQLAAFGVKAVVDLQADGQADEQQLVEKAGMKFFRIPMTTHKAPTVDELASFLTLVNNPANQPVYVHCAGGRHRTGVMTAAYRMTHDGWTADQAFKEMKQYKFGAEFLHPEFKKYVYAFRSEPLSTSPADGAIATTILPLK